MTWGITFWGVEEVKRFVNVNLHCIVSNLKRTSKMLPHPGKNTADAHAGENTLH